MQMVLAYDILVLVYGRLWVGSGRLVYASDTLVLAGEETTGVNSGVRIFHKILHLKSVYLEDLHSSF